MMFFTSEIAKKIANVQKSHLRHKDGVVPGANEASAFSEMTNIEVERLTESLGEKNMSAEVFDKIMKISYAEENFVMQYFDVTYGKLRSSTFSKTWLKRLL